MGHQKKEIAKTYRQKKYSCSQTILATYADEINMSEDMACRLGEGLSGGLASRKETCGAVLAMALVLSYKFSGGTTKHQLTKANTCSIVDKSIEDFIDKNQSHICKYLLEHNTVSRTCNTLILDCVDIIDEFLKEESTDIF